jgi:hypothetical protein
MASSDSTTDVPHVQYSVFDSDLIVHLWAFMT